MKFRQLGHMILALSYIWICSPFQSHSLWDWQRAQLSQIPNVYYKHRKFVILRIKPNVEPVSVEWILPFPNEPKWNTWKNMYTDEYLIDSGPTHLESAVIQTCVKHLFFSTHKEKI